MPFIEEGFNSAQLDIIIMLLSTYPEFYFLQPRNGLAPAGLFEL